MRFSSECKNHLMTTLVMHDEKIISIFEAVMEERNSNSWLAIFSISLFAHGFQRTPAVIFMSLYDLSRVTSLVSLHYALFY